jgi:hypothetical protein
MGIQRLIIRHGLLAVLLGSAFEGDFTLILAGVVAHLGLPIPSRHSGRRWGASSATPSGMGSAGSAELGFAREGSYRNPGARVGGRGANAELRRLSEIPQVPQRRSDEIGVPLALTAPPLILLSLVEVPQYVLQLHQAIPRRRVGRCAEVTGCTAGCCLDGCHRPLPAAPDR